jgi:hypothetical protein
MGASESYVTTVTPLAIAPLSVGQSAAGSVAETIRMLAPLVIAPWMAGIWELGVAEVPLVSVPCSLNAFKAKRAPPLLTLSEVLKYGLPRFFGITNAFRPFSSGRDDLEAAVATPDTATMLATARPTVTAHSSEVRRWPLLMGLFIT